MSKWNDSERLSGSPVVSFCFLSTSSWLGHKRDRKSWENTARDQEEEEEETGWKPLNSRHHYFAVFVLFSCRVTKDSLFYSHVRQKELIRRGGGGICDSSEFITITVNRGPHEMELKRITRLIKRESASGSRPAQLQIALDKPTLFTFVLPVWFNQDPPPLPIPPSSCTTNHVSPPFIIRNRHE